MQSLETVVDFVRATGVDVFAPAIGNAHGMYKTTPKLDNQRVTDIVEATGMPVALHGGTGMSRRAVQRPDRPRLRQGQHLTALKIAFMKSGYDYMTEHPGEYDPPKLFAAQRAGRHGDGEGPHPALRQRREGLD